MDDGMLAWTRGGLDGDVVAAWSIDAVRSAEKATGSDFEDGTLMRRAAAALARIVGETVREKQGTYHRVPSVTMLIGPGNNGADAAYAAAHLVEWEIPVTLVVVSDRWHEKALEAARSAGARVLHSSSIDDECSKAVREADIVVDGVLGTGARGTRLPKRPNPRRRPSELSHEDHAWFNWVGPISSIQPSAHVIAVDMPSPGIERADLTVTFGAPKTSLMLEPERVGRIEVVDIGLDLDSSTVDALRWNDANLADEWPVPGPHDHKYTRGVVGMATGSDDFPGAAVLGTVAAATAGAGMVRYVGPDRPSDAVLAAVPEAVHGAGRVQAWVVGSGIDGETEKEQNSERYRSATKAFEDDVPVVVDAGALPWLGEIERPEGSVTVITPHAGELAGVLAAFDVRDDDGDEVTREVIEADPVRWARAASHVTGATVVLKGGVTVIASGDGPVVVENRAPHWLATAGTGDVLAAVVGVALAAGLQPRNACTVAAYVHGRAAHLANPGGPVRALDVAQHVGRAIAELTNEQVRRLEARHAGVRP